MISFATETPVSVTAEQIHTLLERVFSPLSLEVLDDSARHAGHEGARSGGHFRIALESHSFAGRSPLERHRMVYEALASLMGRGIHAVTIHATAPRSVRRSAP